MANLIAGGMRSWGVVNEYEGASNSKIEQAWKAVEFMKKNDLDEGASPQVVLDPEGEVVFVDMPLHYSSLL